MNWLDNLGATNVNTGNLCVFFALMFILVMSFAVARLFD